MFKHSTKFIMVGVATAAALASAGCSKKQLEEGAAQVSVQALSLSTDVKAVDVAVSGNGISSPMNMPLYKQADGSWKGLVSHIPVGTDRVFAAKAYDSTAKTQQIYSGSVTAVTIAKDLTADVIIVLQEDLANTGFSNHAPVIDGLTVSSTTVTYGDHVAYTLTAHDQDVGETATLTFTPTVTCGSFGTPTITTAGTNRVWSALWTAPSVDSACQINMEVKDVKDAKAMAAVTITVNAGADMGSARVTTLFESYPVITGITASPDFLTVGVPSTLNMVVTMSDAEVPSFLWSSADCSSALTNTTAQSPVVTLGAGTNPATCTFNVVVSGPAKVDSKGISHQLTTAGHITLNVGQTIVTVGTGGLVIDLTSQSLEAANDGDAVTLYVKARETSPGVTISNIVWSKVDGTFGTQTDASDKTDSQMVWTAPTPIAPVESVTVTVTDSTGSTASYVFVIRSASNPCAAAGSDGVTCNDGDACTTGDVCLAGACHGTAITCTALDQCHEAGTCSDGTCSNPAKADGASCDDSNSCTQTDQCAGGTCVGGNSVVCTAQDQCHDVGTCAPSTGTCTQPAKADGVACNDSNACTTGETCQAGTCSATTATTKTCTALDECHTVGTCDPANGNCSNPVATDGTACSDNNGCTTGETCLAGACSTSTATSTVCTASDMCHTIGACDQVAGMCPAEVLSVTCSYGQFCVPTSGQCALTCPAPKYAQKYAAVSSIAGMAVDANGVQYIATTLATSTDFGAGTVTSAGSADIVLAKLNPATGTAVGSAGDPAGTYWAKAFGDAQDQTAAGLAVSHSDQLGAIGTFSGTLTVGNAISNTDSVPHDFIVGVSNSGTGLWAVAANTQLGTLLSIASNPARDEFVVCGYTLGNVTDLGITGSNNTDGYEDIIIAKLNSSTGAVMWARQIGGTGTQMCSSVAMDADGVVYASGIYNGVLDFGNGALAAPGTSINAVWVAKLNASTGAGIASQAFGTTVTAKQGLRSIAIDSSGNIAIAGNLKTSMTFGSNTPLTAAGGTDGFVAKLNNSLVPQWSRNWGDSANQEAHGVAFNSIGDVIVVGYLKGTTTGLSSSPLVATGTSADAYWAKFNGSDGTSVCAAVYGDSSSQSAEIVAISNAATNGQKDMVNVAGYFNGDMNYSSKLGLTFSATSASGYLIQFNP
jgi:hypothetical protein